MDLVKDGRSAGTAKRQAKRNLSLSTTIAEHRRRHPPPADYAARIDGPPPHCFNFSDSTKGILKLDCYRTDMGLERHVAPKPTDRRRKCKLKGDARHPARLMALAVIALVPLILDRVRDIETDRTERVEAASKQALNLAKQGMAAQNEVFVAVRAFMQVASNAQAILLAGTSAATASSPLP